MTERSEIKEICNQPSSYCILAGFSLIPRLALNQAALQGFPGCRIITCSGVSLGEMFHVLPQQSQPLHWRFPALFHSFFSFHSKSLFPLDSAHEKEHSCAPWLHPTLQDKQGICLCPATASSRMQQHAKEHITGSGCNNFTIYLFQQ